MATNYTDNFRTEMVNAANAIGNTIWDSFSVDNRRLAVEFVFEIWDVLGVKDIRYLYDVYFDPNRWRYKHLFVSHAFHIVYHWHDAMLVLPNGIDTMADPELLKRLADDFDAPGFAQTGMQTLQEDAPHNLVAEVSSTLDNMGDLNWDTYESNEQVHMIRATWGLWAALAIDVPTAEIFYDSYRWIMLFCHHVRRYANFQGSLEAPWPPIVNCLIPAIATPHDKAKEIEYVE